MEKLSRCRWNRSANAAVDSNTVQKQIRQFAFERVKCPDYVSNSSITKLYKKTPPLTMANRGWQMTNVVSGPKTIAPSRSAAGFYVPEHTTRMLRGACEQGSTKTLRQFHAKALIAFQSMECRIFSGDDVHRNSTGRGSTKSYTSHGLLSEYASLRKSCATEGDEEHGLVSNIYTYIYIFCYMFIYVYIYIYIYIIYIFKYM